MAHQYSRVGFYSSVEVNLSLYYGGVTKTSQFILLISRMDGSTTSCTCLRLSEIVTLSGDQNEVFESLVDFQRLISWNPTVKRFVSFSTFDFYSLISL